MPCFDLRTTSHTVRLSFFLICLYVLQKVFVTNVSAIEIYHRHRPYVEDDRTMELWYFV